MGEEIISQAMIGGARGCDILGGVYTAPTWRQRGAYRQLMAAQMEDCRRLGFRVLTLDTGFELICTSGVRWPERGRDGHGSDGVGSLFSRHVTMPAGRLRCR